MSASHRKLTFLYENCDSEKAWNSWSIRYQQPLSELTSDCHLLWWNNSFFVGHANGLLSATGEINPSLTLSVLMLGGKTDKGNGAEWEKRESLTHLLTWWLTAAICPYLRGAGAMGEVHWPTEGSRGLQSWRGPPEVKNKTTRLTTFNNPHCLHTTSQILTPYSCYIWDLIINPQYVCCSDTHVCLCQPLQFFKGWNKAGVRYELQGTGNGRVCVRQHVLVRN